MYFYIQSNKIKCINKCTSNGYLIARDAKQSKELKALFLITSLLFVWYNIDLKFKLCFFVLLSYIITYDEVLPNTYVKSVQ